MFKVIKDNIDIIVENNGVKEKIMLLKDELVSINESDYSIVNFQMADDEGKLLTDDDYKFSITKESYKKIASAFEHIEDDSNVYLYDDTKFGEIVELSENFIKIKVDEFFLTEGANDEITFTKAELEKIKNLSKDNYHDLFVYDKNIVESYNNINPNIDFESEFSNDIEEVTISKEIIERIAEYYDSDEDLKDSLMKYVNMNEDDEDDEADEYEYEYEEDVEDVEDVEDYEDTVEDYEDTRIEFANKAELNGYIIDAIDNIKNDNISESENDEIEFDSVEDLTHYVTLATMEIMEKNKADRELDLNDENDFTEFIDNVVDEVAHMSASQKLAAKKYRKSAAGKKAAKLNKIKTSKKSYKPDKKRSIAAKKSAKHRR